MGQQQINSDIAVAHTQEPKRNQRATMAVVATAASVGVLALAGLIVGKWRMAQEGSEGEPAQSGHALALTPEATAL
jgi:hypothetical protein